MSGSIGLVLDFCMVDCVSRRIMYMYVIPLFLLVWSSIANTEEDLFSDQECPTWFVPEIARSAVKCVCEESLKEFVLCDHDQHSAFLSLRACMTYNESDGATLVGGCQYNNHRANYQQTYVKLPQNISNLNEFMCGGMNRTGLQCSECEPGLGPAVLSYTHQCLPCLASTYGWLLYVFLVTFPNSVMFSIIILCNIRITSAPLNGFVFVCQVFTSIVNSSPYQYLNISFSTAGHNFFVLLLTCYGILNLDYLRYVISPFCISSKLKVIHLIALEYFVAFYPLIFLIFVYVCVTLHDRGCRLLVCIRRVFKVCFHHQWDFRTTLIHAFAAFLLLSYAKLLSVSHRLLAYGKLYNRTGDRQGHIVLYYDHSVTYFSSQHLPFAALAILILILFVILPMLVLLLYPTRLFQKCLGCFRFRWHALHIFADAFQGCYKNGTTGTHDYRYFAGIYLLVRVVIITAYTINAPVTFRLLVRVLVPATVSLLFSLLRPYRDNRYNILDCVGFALYALLQFWIVCNEYINSVPLQFAYLLTVLPFIYISIYIGYNLLLWMGLVQRCSHYKKITSLLQWSWSLLLKSETDIDGLPDRVIHPENYEALLPTADGENRNMNSEHAEINTFPACGNSSLLYGNA